MNMDEEELENKSSLIFTNPERGLTQEDCDTTSHLRVTLWISVDS